MCTSDHFRVKKFDLGDYTKYFLTIDLNSCVTFEEIEDIYKKLTGYLRENEIQVIYEKAFGTLEFKSSIMKLRKSLIKTFNLDTAPFSYIEGAPTSGSPISSITIFGIASKGDIRLKRIKSIKGISRQTIGTSFVLSGSRYIYLLGLTCRDKVLTGSISEYRSLFDDILNYIDNSGFSASDIIRTWLYLDKMDDNYSNLNTARREFFERNNINYSSTSNDLPSSTCIGGRFSKDSTLAVDVFCIDKSILHPAITRMYNQLQNEAEGKAYQFKSTFARATSIDYKTHCEIQISGTASIDTTGETVFVGDPYNQIKKTLQNVKSLLDQKNMSFDDLCISTCFFKRPEYYSLFEEVLEELGIGNFTNTFVAADVCRSNLLFELDGVAVKSTL